jgi:FSR family fosmidomycin resistance protein-like MFS transporter
MTTESPSVAQPSVRATELRIISGVSAAHFLSHFYFMLLPPVLLWVRADYNLSYTELGLAFTVFNAVSAVFQTPAGILADRVGAYTVLVAGLVLEAIAFGLVGIVNSFWFLVAMFAVAGLGNTVFHPADYALLSHHVAKERVGSAFSFHTFSGLLGNAVAPACVLFIAAFLGWRGAFVAAAIAGLAVAALLVLQRDDYANGAHLAARGERKRGTDWSLLLSGPIVRSLLFFAVLAAVNVGVQNYTVAALNAAYGTSPEIGNTALTANMLLSAVGVLAGGLIVNRLANHGLFAAAGIAISCLAIAVVGFVDLSFVPLMIVMAISGFANGIIMPSRDMIVREVTPPGSFGTVFGFVTTGFNVAGVLFPLVFGAIMDHGNPRAVFFVSAACGILAIATVMTVRRRGPGAIAP